TLFTVEEEVELPDSSNIVRTGYDFTGWHEAENLEDDAVTKIEKGTYENKTFYASWTEGTVNYSVKHFIQTQDESGYDEKTEDEQLLTGTTNATTMAVAKNYEGYFAQKIEQKTINADGSTVVNIYYDRSYSIQYDLDGGENSEDNIECYTDKHLPLTLKEPSKAGFKFFGWVSENNELVSEISMDSREKISLKALWYQEGEAYYLVKHNLQSLEDENLYVFKEQNYCLGNVGTTASPTENYYSGFEKKSVENKTIGADGSTTVNINYSRKNYRVLFTVNYEDRKNSPSFTLEGRYQEKIVIPENSFSSEYIIDKCEPSTPTFFGDKSSGHYEISLKSKYEYYLTGSEQVKIPVIFRDFRGYTEKGTGDGYITAEIANACRTPFVAGRGHPDFERMSGSGEEGLVATDLGEDGLPVFVKMHNENDITKESFDMWYRDVPGVNITIRDKELVFTRSNGSKRIYKYSSTNGSQGFFPIDNEGYGKTPGYNHNGGFTDEMTFYFTYAGDEEIYISGDDDIWVFINGKLAIDLGGLHAEKSSGITLDGKEITENGKTFKYNEKFNIVEGQKVEVKIFHAERCASGSNFTLRLTGLDMYERELR
ncbi:MAG: fibro-slime domain-containing protein, partial [Treponema sp.]|nr:fibro-slime domain-containing protein [Treponema sp.]